MAVAKGFHVRIGLDRRAMQVVDLRTESDGNRRANSGFVSLRRCFGIVDDGHDGSLKIRIDHSLQSHRAVARSPAARVVRAVRKNDRAFGRILIRKGNHVLDRRQLRLQIVAHVPQPASELICFSFCEIFVPVHRHEDRHSRVANIGKRTAH